MSFELHQLAPGAPAELPQRLGETEGVEQLPLFLRGAFLHAVPHRLPLLPLLLRSPLLSLISALRRSAPVLPREAALGRWRWPKGSPALVPLAVDLQRRQQYCDKVRKE